MGILSNGLEDYDDIESIKKAIKGLYFLKHLDGGINDNPFILPIEEMIAEYNSVTMMLNNYINILTELKKYESWFTPIDTKKPAGTTNTWKGENAPAHNPNIEAEGTLVNAAATNKKHGNAYRPDIDKIEVMKLREKGYSYQKIGRLLNCSPNTARSRIAEE